MQENLNASIDLILASEGGYVNDPAGGPTNLGITLATLSAWRKKPTTAFDVEMLPVAEAEAIYTSQYAAKIDFQALPIGLDYAVLDYCVNSGPAQAAKALQDLVGTVADGIIGAKTLAAIRTTRADLIPDYCAARLAYMKSLTNWGPNANGWSARVARVQADAIRMEMGSNVLARVVIEPPSSTKATGAVKITATGSGRAALATLGTVLATAGAAAAAASTALQPYAALPTIRNVLLGLTVLAAISAFVVAYRRAAGGATA